MPYTLPNTNDGFAESRSYIMQYRLYMTGNKAMFITAVAFMIFIRAQTHHEAADRFRNKNPREKEKKNNLNAPVP